MAFDYLISTRKLVGEEFKAEPGPLRMIRVSTDAVRYRATDVYPRAKWVAEVQGLADGDENPNSISPTGDVLVFVHGYNNEIESVLKRTRQLRSNLRAEGWRGEVVAFDWPSNNQVLNYLEDRSDGAKVAVQLVDDCIRSLMVNQRAGCTTNVHLLGHSTGAYVIMEAFARSVNDGKVYTSDWRIGQVAFIAADVSRTSLAKGKDSNNEMFKRIMRLTNYSNGNDAVLAVSNAKRLGVDPRAGRVGLPDDVDAKAVNVDCSTYFAKLDPKTSPHEGSWTHSWHIGDRVFARDLAMSIEGAIDRNAIPTRNNSSGALVLQAAPRPKFMSSWGIDNAAKDQTRYA